MLPECEAPRPLFVVRKASAELFVLLKVGPDSLVEGTVVAGKLNPGMMIFKRGDERTVRFDPEILVSCGLEAETLDFDLGLLSDRGCVVLGVDDEAGKIGGSPRFDGRVGRCFVRSEVLVGGAGAATRGSPCDGRDVSGTERPEEGCAGLFF